MNFGSRPLLVPLLCLTAAGLLALGLTHADDTRPPRKVAFLVGVSKYDHDFKNLEFAEADATALAAVLKEGGFEVVTLTGSAKGSDRATKKNIEKRLAELLEGGGDENKKIRKGDLVLIALSGHGQQMFVKDESAPGGKREDMFFAPADGMTDKSDSLVNLSRLLDETLAPYGARNLVLVDACRDIADANKSGKGIEGRDIALKGETAVLFSCARGEKSFENSEIKHGVFTWAVLQGLKGEGAKRGEVTWSSLTTHVEDALASDEFKKMIPTNRTQTPIPTRGQLRRTPLFTVASTSVPPKPVPPALADGESEQEFEYVIDGEKNRGKCRVLTLDIGGGQKMEFVLIKAGSFLMGAPAAEKEASDEEMPQHRVTIARDFYLGRTTVTQDQYKALVDENPSEFKGNGSSPVENVSWDDVVAFCTALGKKTDRKVRLPWEAEWEYAARAGTTTPFHFGGHLNGDLANCDGHHPYGPVPKGIFLEKPVPVGSYPANPWGLLDMHGNIYQWCGDYYGPYKDLEERDPSRTEKYDNKDLRVLRGGSWYFSARFCRSAYRDSFEPGDRSHSNGFRVCLPLD